jgi:hypothetical protein
VLLAHVVDVAASPPHPREERGHDAAGVLAGARCFQRTRGAQRAAVRAVDGRGALLDAERPERAHALAGEDVGHVLPL